MSRIEPKIGDRCPDCQGTGTMRPFADRDCVICRGQGVLDRVGWLRYRSFNANPNVVMMPRKLSPDCPDF